VLVTCSWWECHCNLSWHMAHCHNTVAHEVILDMVLGKDD
jgi:hypothetical protein